MDLVLNFVKNTFINPVIGQVLRRLLGHPTLNNHKKVIGKGINHTLILHGLIDPLLKPNLIKINQTNLLFLSLPYRRV
jgi:hypothetical protein